MRRTTVDLGIDLGTTNSAVAVLRGVQTEVIKNNDGQETTPSAVAVDRRQRLWVGQSARERSEHDPENTCLEFKLRMGTVGQDKRFAAAGRTMSPEALSAEVLKSLRADATGRLNEDVRAAVITVPAAFDLSACAATERAAALAGLEHTVLLQEPAAAAHAYGFQATDENATWLVYDFGGGTFDAAVIRLRDGEFSVVGHRGDNTLGGKLLDWRIVEELFIPAAIRQSPGLAGLERGNPRWFGAIAALKWAAEAAKIRLSRAATVTALADLPDDARRSHEFEYDLTRADLERLAEPFITRSVNLCRAALEELRLGAADIDKVIMVGGQTAMPYLRDRVADRQRGLGAALDFTQDPMTVVARGAAVFAGAQPLPAGWGAAVPEPGTCTVRCEYPRVGPDLDPVVVARVTTPDDTPAAGWSVELVNEESDPPWRSGRLTLTDQGAFTATLRAERGRQNTFHLRLTDPSGTRRPTSPDLLTYTVGAVEAEPMLTHAVGVGLADNQVRPLVERGARLPVRRTTTLRTTLTVQRGEAGGLIRIPVLEGEQPRADRNRTIGRIEVGAAEVARTVPAGSEVHLTIEIDASRLVRVSAFVPLLDETFETTVSLLSEPVLDTVRLADEVAAERDRLAQLRDRQRGVRSPVVELQLQRIVDEAIEEDLARLLAAARADEGAAADADSRLRDLRLAADAIEEELSWPELVGEAESLVIAARDLIAAHGSASDRSELPVFEQEINDAIEAREAGPLRMRCDRLREHLTRVLDRAGALQPMVFHQLVQERAAMRHPAQAERLIREGEAARDRGEQERLRSINLQLGDLLPGPPPPIDLSSTVESAG
ncbi:Hsp70 family protein [Streptomyces sp. 796.1]|uniref:Hsp70 family protein n=1 Tax=Streptomyces sp. 796.1 TaxID=3163029 RepID=UPI0039C9EA70